MADVAVRALEWCGNGFAHTNTGMVYRIKPDAGGFVLSKHEGSAEWKSFHGSEEDAKAAAQADYEKRILANLVEATAATPADEHPSSAS